MPFNVIPLPDALTGKGRNAGAYAWQPITWRLNIHGHVTLKENSKPVTFCTDTTTKYELHWSAITLPASLHKTAGFLSWNYQTRTAFNRFMPVVAATARFTSTRTQEVGGGGETVAAFGCHRYFSATFKERMRAFCYYDCFPNQLVMS